MEIPSSQGSVGSGGAAPEALPLCCEGERLPRKRRPSPERDGDFKALASQWNKLQLRSGDMVLKDTSGRHPNTWTPWSATAFAFDNIGLACSHAARKSPHCAR